MEYAIILVNDKNRYIELYGSTGLGVSGPEAASLYMSIKNDNAYCGYDIYIVSLGDAEDLLDEGNVIAFDMSYCDCEEDDGYPCGNCIECTNFMWDAKLSCIKANSYNQELEEWRGLGEEDGYVEGNSRKEDMQNNSNNSYKGTGPFKNLIMYTRYTDRTPFGCIVACRCKDGVVRIAGSKCNVLDRFNKSKGKEIAMARIKSMEKGRNGETPWTLYPYMVDMGIRARAYFQDAKDIVISGTSEGPRIEYSDYGLIPLTDCDEERVTEEVEIPSHMTVIS